MRINYEGLVDKLSAELDIKILQNKLIASNVANVDTPGYKAKDLKFANVLQDEMGNMHLKKTHPSHMESSTTGIKNNEIVEDPNPGRPDGNNVNIDDELLKLSKNNIQYSVAVQLLAKYLGQIRESILQAR
ncbi:MAG TPA: flagellar basal body rod protein FlgB [Candidatus Deferrimicrobium sp.]|nr:flagellar basal body rod protein FlgB [Candidatus Kapabacteria bacterium]HLP60307.1 flagellar basal body rod protein FlgB [Candidatus Deferrimicrobium sp.]